MLVHILLAVCVQLAVAYRLKDASVFRKRTIENAVLAAEVSR